ncbi:hypothetical protein MRX96_014260 [Rhipicephalus microplus]
MEFAAGRSSHCTGDPSRGFAMRDACRGADAVDKAAAPRSHCARTHGKGRAENQEAPSSGIGVDPSQRRRSHSLAFRSRLSPPGPRCLSSHKTWPPSINEAMAEERARSGSQGRSR